MLKIIKIGGNIVDNPAKLSAFLADFAAMEGERILVHGGGKVATAIAAALGIETVMIDGRRMTDARTLEVVTMVYNGINKQIVGTLQRLGCDAAGLCGADGRLIVSRRRSPEPIDYGFVGDPVAVNTVLVRTLTAAGHTLVVAPITLDGSVGCNPKAGEACGTATGAAAGGLLNTNADTVAQTVATAMAGAGESVELIYCFEKQGVLRDVDDENSVIPTIDAARFAELKASGAVHSGMLPKLENAFRALERGVERVVICAAENIARPGYGGTTIVK